MDIKRSKNIIEKLIKLQMLQVIWAYKLIDYYGLILLVWCFFFSSYYYEVSPVN